MFTVNHQTNRVSSVKIKKFSEPGFTERKHSQEWFTYESEAPGEELLIFQKESVRFDDNRKHLGLLAHDRNVLSRGSYNDG